MAVTIELAGLEVFGYHGVDERERRDGHTFLFDIAYDVSDDAASDDLSQTVDYREVVATVREVSDGRAFQLLEALAAAVAHALLSRFPVERVRVRVRKPGVQLDTPAEYSAATVERRA